MSKDLPFTSALSTWLGSNDPSLEMVLAVTSWGDLLNSAGSQPYERLD